MNEIEALFDNFLASKGLNRNSPVSGVDPSAFVAEWEIFILNYGRNQGRAGQGPVTGFGTPAPYGGTQYQPPTVGPNPGQIRPAPTYGAGGAGPVGAGPTPGGGGGNVRYAPPIATNRR